MNPSAVVQTKISDIFGKLKTKAGCKYLKHTQLKPLTGKRGRRGMMKGHAAQVKPICANLRKQEAVEFHIPSAILHASNNQSGTKNNFINK